MLNDDLTEFIVCGIKSKYPNFASRIFKNIPRGQWSISIEYNEPNGDVVVNYIAIKSNRVNNISVWSSKTNIITYINIDENIVSKLIDVL